MLLSHERLCLAAAIRHASHGRRSRTVSCCACLFFPRAQAVLAASAVQTAHAMMMTEESEAASSPRQESDKHDDAFDPLDVGATPSFEEVFG